MIVDIDSTGASTMLIYNIILFTFLIWTIINSLFMPKLHRKTATNSNKFVSILIPVRNEENNIKPLINSLKNLNYQNYEVILLNDQSTDLTKEYILSSIKDDDRFILIDGDALPTGWTGKVYACHQLSKKARGELLLFLDADIRLHQNTLQSAIHTLQSRSGKLLTGFPRFPVAYLLEKWLVPMQHFLIYFHLPLFFANYTKLQSATAAHGSFMLFDKESYINIGGHESIKHSLLDDVHLARLMKKHHQKVLLTNITSYVTCYMYTSNKEVWNGFKKNIFIGIGRSVSLAILLTMFYLFFFILPGILLLYGIVQIVLFHTVTWLLLFPYIIIALQKFIIDWQTKQKTSLCFAMPLIAFTFITLLNASMITSLTKNGYKWKGRTYL